MKNSVVETFVLLVLLCFGIGARAENVITLSSTEGAPGDEVTVSIALSNTDAVSSLQLSIPFDENKLTLVDDSGLLGSRCPGHQVMVGAKDGVITVFVYSLSMATISGNSGVIASFKLKLGTWPGTYTLESTTTTLVSSDGSTVAATTESCTVTVNGARIAYDQEELNFGRVPIGNNTDTWLQVTNEGNANLVISGIIFSDVNNFSSTSEFPITLAPGESGMLAVRCSPKSRSVLNQTMTVICNSPNTKNTFRLKAEPYVVNELVVEPARGASDEEVTIHLTMNNNDAVSGYQIEFEMPKSLLFVEGSFELSDRKQDHTNAVFFDGTTLRVIVYSPADKPFLGNEGEIGSFKVKLNGRESTTLTPTNVVLSATIDNVVTNVVSNYVGGWIAIVCPYIVGDDELNFWDIPVTEDCEREYAVSNTGEVPLTISRIVFDNELFSISAIINGNGELIDPVFPVEIPTGEVWYLRVRYNSLEEAPFNGVMQIHCNDPEMRLKEVSLKGRRYAPNFLYFQTHDVSTKGMLNIQVIIDNYDAINGIQFDLEFPDGYQPFENNYSLGPKAAGMEVSVTQIANKTFRYILYSLSDNSIERGLGELMTIKFKPVGESLPVGEYQFFTRNITLGTQDMENKFWSWGCDDCNFCTVFYVKDVVQGDVNSDNKVTITDAVGIVNSILGNYYSSFEYAAADVNGDGQITITDAVGVVNIILNSGSASAPAMDMKEPEPMAEPE